MLLKAFRNRSDICGFPVIESITPHLYSPKRAHNIVLFIGVDKMIEIITRFKEKGLMSYIV